MNNNNINNTQIECKCSKELQEIKETILLLTKAIENLTKTCGRMDSHINFVEDTYDTLKTPLNYLTQKVAYITGSNTTKELKD
jgi:hypothetical protein